MASHIYTRTGDTGETGLFGGQRVPKDALRVDAYGTVDELNAVLGAACAQAVSEELKSLLLTLQSDLFLLGADLATPERPGGRERRTEDLRILDGQVARLEAEIDQLNAALGELTSFVLPGGTPAAAALHVARTVCRRAERAAVTLAGGELVSGPALKYLNRLSDLLFVAARYANDRGAADVLWTPGGTR